MPEEDEKKASYKEFREKLDERCEVITEAYSELYQVCHETLENMEESKLDEAAAYLIVKMNRMTKEIEKMSK